MVFERSRTVNGLQETSLLFCFVTPEYMCIVNNNYTPPKWWKLVSDFFSGCYFLKFFLDRMPLFHETKDLGEIQCWDPGIGQADACGMETSQRHLITCFLISYLYSSSYIFCREREFSEVIWLIFIILIVILEYSSLY